MKKVIGDRRLIIGYLLAHLLLLFTFEHENVLWYILTASMLVLISYSILYEVLEDTVSTFSYFTYGMLSGFGLFWIFWIGSTLIDLLNLPFREQITSLYKLFSPEFAWQYILLIFIIAPGEEIFWRGFVQRRLLKYIDNISSIFVSTLLYASVQFYSGEFILVVAALVGGLVWSALYVWKRSIPLVVISHIVFDLLLFGFFPLR